MPGEFCLIFYRGRLQCARVLERGKTKWRIGLEEGPSISYPGGQVLYRWAEPGDNGASTPEALRETGRALAARAAKFDLAALRRNTAGAAMLPFETLAAAALGSEGAEAGEKAALYLALSGPASPFHREKGGFVPRPEGEAHRRAKTTRQPKPHPEWLDKVAGWCAELNGGRWPDAPGGEREEFLAALESLLALEKRSPFWNLLAKPLELKASRMAEQAPQVRRLLEAGGHWRGWPALWLTGAGVAEGFDPEVEAAAREVARLAVQHRGRRDFRSAPAYTIDSAGTRDMDDALAILDSGPDGMRVAVHIAHPGPGLEPGGVLFNEARTRISSVYTPDNVYPMLPPTLSTGRFPLTAGMERETVTLVLWIGEGEGRLESVEAGLVKVEANLAYEGAEPLLAGDPEGWGRLARLCGALAEARKAKGAHPGRRDGVMIDRSDPSRLRLVPFDRGGAAQTLVEELAILVNGEAGNYFQKHGLPALYRVQEGGGLMPPELQLERNPPTRFSVAGGPHGGVARDRYVQVTSPIRRFADLVMQRQLIAHALGEPTAFPDKKELAAWGELADRRLALHSEVENRIDNYWKREYLAQNLYRPYRGTVRRAGRTKVAKVWLEEVFLSVDARLRGHSEVGDQETFRMVSVDPDGQRAEVEPW